MSTIKISEAEFPLMEYIWDNTPVTAAQIAVHAAEQFGWHKNTTYTVIKRLCSRGALERTDPRFIIRPIVTRSEVLRAETDELIDRVYKGSLKMFLVSFLEREDISPDELAELQNAIDKRRE